MNQAPMFDSTKRPLGEILQEIRSGKMQLPDFQRGWVWDDDRIRGLLASISQAFPIGALMTLETGGDGVRFKPRPVEGTDPSACGVEPEKLILDGQQRLTSLYQALFGKSAVHTKDAKGKRLKQWYYVDMEAVLDPAGDPEEAVISLPEDRQEKKFGHGVGLDLSSPEREYEQLHFPVPSVFEPFDWRQGYSAYWKYDPEKMKLFDAFERSVIKRFEQYLIPVIRLAKETPKEAVCLVFEKVNTGGVSLTVFELLTASFAAENFLLRDDWQEREARLKERYPVLRKLQNDDFLQAICLLATQQRRRHAISSGTSSDQAPGISCKRRDILKLEVGDYQEWADRVEEGFERAARFLYQQKIFKAKDVPYRTQVVPLATILADLGADGESDGARRKIARWFWCGILGELYGGAIESRFARDLPEMAGLVRGDNVDPISINDASFQPNRLLTLRTRNSAAYKGLYALLMRDGCRDFRTGEPIEYQAFFDDKIDIHHIFPRAWCRKAGVKPNTFNSIINKTAISARTNRKIGGRAPSAYLKTLERDADIAPDRMSGILESHRILSKAMRDDDFWRFFAERAEALQETIANAMEKPIPRMPELFRSDATPDDYTEEPEEWDEDDEVLEEEAGVR